MRRLSNWCWLLMLLCVALRVTAQACPTDVLLSINRAGSGCLDVTRNTACYGIGTVDAFIRAGFDVTFALPGERAPLASIEQVTTNSSEAFSMVLLQLQSDIAPTQPGRNVSLLAFGDTTLYNDVPPVATARVTSTGTLNIRAAPTIEADILQQLPLRTSLTASGITADRNWLRVDLPDSVAIGWVAVEVIDTTDDLRGLDVVTVDTPYLRPFQVMRVQTSHEDAPCDGTPQSGILLQSPGEDDTTTLTINGAQISLAGTLFMQAVPDEAMHLRLLDGQARISAHAATQFLVPGAELQITLDNTLTASDVPQNPRPYDFSIVASLPLNNLGYRMRAARAISQDELDALIAVLEAAPTPRPQRPDPELMRCTRNTTTRVLLYAGPGTFYEVIREMRANTPVQPVLRLVDSEGDTWWQVREGHWLRAELTQSSGECPQIALTDVIEPPDSNYLSIEICESSNGPIRAGQWVTLDFVAGSWRTRAAAWDSARWDPGRITVNSQHLSVHASAPVKVAEERWYRTFGSVWRAEAGTFRIVGERLDYQVICDITVPTG